MEIAVATWNTEWRTPSSDAGGRVTAILESTGADIIVVTEGVRELLPDHGYTVDAGPDWGYPLKPARRKVIVWSRYPLTLDFIGVDGATLGRLAVATAALPAGPVRVLGVCIPWQDAHVRSGRCDAQPWSEHLDYLDHLEQLLPKLGDGLPTVIAGDFNQRIPRMRQPIRVADRLTDVLAGWTIHTAGALPNGPHIDHIATNGRLVPTSVHDWPASDQFGRLSDHAGVVCRLTYADGSTPVMVNSSASEAEAAATSGSIRKSDPPRADHGALTAELRTEIEEVLRRSGDGLSHGATFRLLEQGLDDAEIAARRGVSVSATRVFLRSLDALLDGRLPTTKSGALTNSYVYRELLNHARSDALDNYVKAQLRKLKEINPDVRFDPLATRSHQYRIGERKPKKAIDDSCPECAAIGVTHSGQC